MGRALSDSRSLRKTIVRWQETLVTLESHEFYSWEDVKKYEEEYKKEEKNLEEYSRYTEQMEESVGNLSTCLDKIEVSLRNIESILLSASANKKISKKLYKEVMGEMDAIKEHINDVDEDR